MMVNLMVVAARFALVVTSHLPITPQAYVPTDRVCLSVVKQYQSDPALRMDEELPLRYVVQLTQLFNSRSKNTIMPADGRPFVIIGPDPTVCQRPSTANITIDKIEQRDRFLSTYYTISIKGKNARIVVKTDYTKLGFIAGPSKYKQMVNRSIPSVVQSIFDELYKEGL